MNLNAPGMMCSADLYQLITLGPMLFHLQCAAFWKERRERKKKRQQTKKKEKNPITFSSYKIIVVFAKCKEKEAVEAPQQKACMELRRTGWFAEARWTWEWREATAQQRQHQQDTSGKTLLVHLCERFCSLDFVFPLEFLRQRGSKWPWDLRKWWLEWPTVDDWMDEWRDGRKTLSGGGANGKLTPRTYWLSTGTIGTDLSSGFALTSSALSPLAFHPVAFHPVATLHCSHGGWVKLSAHVAALVCFGWLTQPTEIHLLLSAAPVSTGNSSI